MSLGVFVTGGGDIDVEGVKANKIEELGRGGETRAIYFDDPLVIHTGVPRTGRDDDWQCPPMDEKDPAHPIHAERLARLKAETAAPSAGSAPVAVSPTTSAPPVAAPKAVEWKRITTEISPPDERSVGVIAEGRFCIQDGEVCVEDLWGKPLGAVALKPGDDPAIVARKLLREKHGKHSSFYAPIRYPTSYH